jgi:hypothetical protein
MRTALSFCFWLIREKCKWHVPRQTRQIHSGHHSKKVNLMKRSILAIAIMFSMACSASVFAEEQAAPANPAEPVATISEAPVPENPGTPPAMYGGGQHGKGQGGKMHGGGQHGKGQGGKMHGGGRHGKAGNHDERQVTQRLDMIEARLAKIEAMLEILVRR